MASGLFCWEPACIPGQPANGQRRGGGVHLQVVFVESHNLDYPDPLGSHQYIRLFAQSGHQCIWVGPAISPLHLFKADRTNRHRFKVWLAGGRRVGGIDWMIPFTLMPYYDLPLLRSNFAGRNHYRFCLPPVAGRLKKAGFGEPDVLWCAGPVALGLLDLVPHRVSCFRLADRLDQFSRIPAGIRELQRELVKRVDLVFATSRELVDWARRVKGDQVHYLPNGVNDFFFAGGEDRPTDFPADGRPVVVFVGTVDSWFDIDTLEYAVENLKGLHFLVIGSVKDKYILKKMDILSKKDNFTWQGGRDHWLIPAYLGHCAVGIIPFHLNELTHAVNPIKYYEYLACGLPVVASKMRELVELQGPLFVYEGREGFCEALERAVKSRSEGTAHLVDYARGHTWESRFEQVLKMISERLQ